MSERPTDAPDGPTEAAEALPPVDDATDGVNDEGALEPETISEDVEGGDSGRGDETWDASGAQAAEAEVERARRMSPSERRAMRAAERSQIQVDESLRIKDRASALFVMVTVGVFALIVANALLFGTGGFLSPTPTPSPVPSLTPGPSPTAAPSGSPAASPTAAPTASPTAEPSQTPGAS